MYGLQGNQKRVLEYLLANPSGATLEEIASHLEITKSAAKQHIVKVESLGYLTYSDSKGFIGRPKRRYLLSGEGQEVFPKQYSWLSNSLLEILSENLGRDAVVKLMESLADKVSASLAAKLEKSQSTADQLSLIVTALNELGYRATLKQSDLRKGAVIEATNCVYHSVAKKHPELCRFDVRFLENTSNLNVKQESCIARGGPVCRFCLTRKSN
jgi:predicted ArsR family transcriptional regulator